MKHISLIQLLAVGALIVVVNSLVCAQSGSTSKVTIGVTCEKCRFESGTVVVDNVVFEK